MKIHSLLTEDMIIPELVSQERDAVLGEMVNFLKAKEIIAKEKELLEKLIQREKLGSTVISQGIAIPHSKLKEIKGPVVALAVSKRGVNFDSIDKKLTHVFFLVITSPDNPSLNLQILAAIAHLVRQSTALKKMIMGSRSLPQAIEIIREEEEKLNE